MKPHTVGGRTIGMVNSESNNPFQRLLTFMALRAAKMPRMKMKIIATPAVLSETHSGR